MNNWLDVVFILTIIFFAFVGLNVGIVRAVVTIGSIMLGLSLASQYYGPLAGQLSVFITDPALANTVAFGMIMMGVVVAFLFVSAVLRALGLLIFTLWADRMAGMFLGIALGFLVSYIIALGLAKFTFGDLGFLVGQSAIGPWLLRNLAFLEVFIPKDFGGFLSILKLS
ncbi:MAG: CvpA family protein [Chloroflexi bacterium]|nr:CvpA family protein [Chloroflexota bacterium]